MNRPFAYLGFSYLLGLLVALFTSVSFALICAVLIGIVWLVLLPFKINNSQLKIALFGFAISIFALLCYQNIMFAPYEKHQGTYAQIKATLNDTISHSDYSTTYDISISEINGEKVSQVKAKLRSSIDFHYTYGDEINCYVVFDENESERAFSYENSLKSDGYVLTSRIDLNKDYDITSTYNQTDFIFSLKQSIRNKIDMMFSDDIADLMQAMLIGDSWRIREDIYYDFRHSGVSHIIAVSGMHLSIIFGLFTIMFRKARIPKSVIYLVLIPLVIIYILICGMSKSVLRAGIMFIMYLIGNSLGEDGDNYNFLGLSALIICIINPYSAVDLGFLLSISATAGIFFLFDKIYKPFKKFKLNKLTELLISSLVVSLSAFIFIMPILIFTTGSINPLSIISSTLLSIPTSIFLTVSVFYVFISYIAILQNILIIPAIIINGVGNFILWICDKIALVGDLIPKLTENRSVILFVGLCLIIAITVLFKPSKLVKITAIICAFVLITSSYFFMSMQNTNPKIIVANAGFGTFAFLLDGGKAAVISSDGYSSYTVIDLFDEYGVNEVEFLDYNKNDISSVSNYILRNYKVNNLSSDENFVFTQDIIIKPLINNKLTEIEIGDKTVIVNKYEKSFSYLSCDLLISVAENSRISSDKAIISDNSTSDINKHILLDDDVYAFIFSDNIKYRRIS